MMEQTFRDFEANFNGHTVPGSLARLFAFQQEYNDFSECFWLHGISKAGLKTYSEDPLFLDHIIEFAQATGSGSTYGLWLKDGKATDLDKAPVVVFGDEGGSHIVASDIQELLFLLSYDCEPMIDWETVYYYKDEDEESTSADAGSYREWLKEAWGISPVQQREDTDRVIARAQEQYQEGYKAWFNGYYREA